VGKASYILSLTDYEEGIDLAINKQKVSSCDDGVEKAKICGVSLAKRQRVLTSKQS
jgi:hypothetical protein